MANSRWTQRTRAKRLPPPGKTVRNGRPRRPASEAFDVVVLAGSAGAEGAIAAMGRSLSARFPIPLIIAQHLGPKSNAAQMYARSLPFKVEWCRDGSRVAAGKALVCPPRSLVELLP